MTTEPASDSGRRADQRAVTTATTATLLSVIAWTTVVAATVAFVGAAAADHFVLGAAVADGVSYLLTILGLMLLAPCLATAGYVAVTLPLPDEANE